MEPDRARAQLDRILASAAFADADRASAFMRFIVNRVLEGRACEIKESVIAVEVLGRNPSFDSRSDSIVRVEAKRLRDRLSSYYTGEGQSDVIEISLPKGTYVPEFSERKMPDGRGKQRNFLLPLAGGTILGVVMAALVFVYLRSPTNPGESANTLRLSILPPEGASFESFAVSPDGRKLAFTATRNGQLMLWVRALDSLTAEPLAGTEFAMYPFWSPDSHSIGFFTISKLKVIDIAGGPPRDIADVVVGLGGAWNGAGTIVFGRRPTGLLYQVPAAGGVPKPVTSLDGTRGEVEDRFPVFLPDGRHFLYLAASSRPGKSAIRVGALDSSISKVLLSADTSAAYAPVLRGHPGSLLFVSDGALMAQRFDPGPAVLSGGRAVVVPQIRYPRWQPAGFSVSANGVLLYQDGSAENHQFAWFDRQGKLLEAIGPRNNYEAFSLSPDEVHIAILRSDDPATVMPTIWVMDLMREGAVSRLSETGVGEANFSPVWSPDGRELLFSRGTDQRMRLLVQAPNGGPAKTILDTEGPKFPTDWSSDGRLVTFSSHWPDYQNMHTWTLPLGGSDQINEPRAFLKHSFGELSARFSPANDGKIPRWVAYTSDETGREEVYVRDFPVGARKWRVSTEGGHLPVWRRDGRELFYLAPDGTLMSAAVIPGHEFSAGTPHPLFNTELRLTPLRVYVNQYAVSRDGRRFLLNRPVPEASRTAITAVVPW